MVSTFSKEDFQYQLTQYRMQHSSPGCRITHMIGIPLIALSFPLSLFNKRLAFTCFVMGWILQFVGHIVFQKNRPVFMTELRSPLTALVAVTFVTEEWIKLLDNHVAEDLPSAMEN